MIIENGHTETISNQDMVSFGLDNSSGQLFAVLSELYSNPIESTIRELCTNCTDAHIMSNNESKPFIIKLPNPEKNIYNLSIRDFGPGLDHEQIFNIYRWYGRSTKTKSNDVTGCLGLGSKSPYSISSTFYVKSYNNGKCSQYVCTMSNTNEPGISETPIVFDTQEENGLEVSIPFYKEVNFEEIIPRILKYFKVKPIVLLPMGELERDVPVKMNWFPETEVYKLTDTIGISTNFKSGTRLFKAVQDSRQNEVIQLQIYYPLDVPLIKSTIDRYNKLFTDQMGETIEKFKISEYRIRIIKRMLSVGVKIYAQPGKVAFAPSRESIKYTDATLFYLIKELNKAAKVFEKQFGTMFQYIDTYEKAFKSIYLGKGDYSYLCNEKLIIPSKNIEYYESEFRKVYNLAPSVEELKDPILRNNFIENNTKFKNFISFTSPSKNRNIFEYGVKFTSPDTTIGLNVSKNDLTNLFNGGRLNWYDLCDVSGKDISYNSSKVLVVSFMTDFIREVNRLCVNKIFYNTYLELKKHVLLELERVYNLDDKEYLEYSLIKNTIYMHLELDFGINLFSNQKFETPGFKESKESFNFYYDKINNYTFSELYTSLKRIMGKSHLVDKQSKWNIDKCLTILNNIINRGFNLKVVSYLYDVKDQDLLALLNLPNSGILNYKSFEIDWSVSYRKFAKHYLKSKRIISKIKDVNLDNLCSDLIKVPGDLEDNLFKSNNIIPFYDIIKIKNKESFGINEIIGQYLLYVSVKFYQDEFDKQIELSQQTVEQKSLYINNILENINIPSTYRININRVELISPPIRSAVKRSKSFDFTKVNKDSEYSDIKSNLYKFDFEPNQEDIDKKEELLFEFVEEMQKILQKIIRINASVKTHPVDKSNDEFNNLTKNYSNDRRETTSYFVIIDKINNNIDRYINKKYKTLSEKFNTIHNLNNWINGLIVSVVNSLHGCQNINNLVKILDIDISRSKDIIPFEGYDVNGDLRRGFVERVTEEFDDDSEDENLIIEKHIIHVDYINTWIFMKDIYPFYMEEEKAEGLYEEYFTSNKFVLFDQNLKISTGINPVPEIDFAAYKKILTDQKTKSDRKSFTDGYYSQKYEIVSYIWPEYIFINNIDRIPVKYQKSVYNFIPLLLSLGLPGTNPESDRLFDLHDKMSLIYNNEIDSSYDTCIIPEISLEFTPNNSFKNMLDDYYTLMYHNKKPVSKIHETKQINLIELLMSGGVPSKQNFENLKKIILLFGNKHVYKSYEKYIDQKYKILYDAVIAYIKIIYPRLKLSDINDLDNLYTNRDILEKVSNNFERKCKDIIDIISSIGRLRNNYYKYINYHSEVTLGDKHKPIPTVNFPKAGLPKTRFTKFLEMLAPQFYDIKIHREVIVSTIENTFKKYIKPERSKKIVKLNNYKNIDGFINKIKEEKKKKELHYKINSRSKRLNKDINWKNNQ